MFKLTHGSISFLNNIHHLGPRNLGYKFFRGSLKFILLSIVLIAITLEWFEYALSPLMFWPNFPSSLKNSLRILVVADPQLLGYSFSCPSPLGYLCRWDADRYVSKTFNYAYDYVKPDLVVFLGDNLDEGEIANDQEFHQYIQRFRKVFQEVNFHKAIVIPGDNDIGGEDEPPSPDLEKRFNKYFRDDIFIPYKFLEFVKVNHITHSNTYLLAPNISDNAVRIVLSHMPLTTLYSSFVSRALPYLQPHIILSAHDHKSSIWIAKRQTGVLIQMAPTSDGSSYSFNISESVVHEIKVPTCSYRMGTDEMGYGALELSPNGEALYAVLWLPPRFRQLFIYLFCIVCLGLYSFFFSSRACCKFIINQSTYNGFKRHQSFLA